MGGLGAAQWPRCCCLHSQQPTISTGARRGQRQRLPRPLLPPLLELPHPAAWVCQTPCGTMGKRRPQRPLRPLLPLLPQNLLKLLMAEVQRPPQLRPCLMLPPPQLQLSSRCRLLLAPFLALQQLPVFNPSSPLHHPYPPLRSCLPPIPPWGLLARPPLVPWSTPGRALRKPSATFLSAASLPCP